MSEISDLNRSIKRLIRLIEMIYQIDKPENKPIPFMEQHSIFEPSKHRLN